MVDGKAVFPTDKVSAQRFEATCMKVRFLIDEDLSLGNAKERHRRNPAIDVLRVGEVGAPSFSTFDPDILLYCEREQGYGIGIYLAELQLIQDASEAEEWLDQSHWIPL